MKRCLTRLTVAAAIAMPALCSPVDAMSQQHQNPLLAPYDTPFQIPPFDKITYADYLPAIRQGIAEQKAEIDAITSNPAAPTFDNTILAMEQSGSLLNRVMMLFSSLNECMNTPEMNEIAREAFPLYSKAQDEIMMNDKLFDRVRKLYDKRDKLGLDGPALRDLELTYN